MIQLRAMSLFLIFASLASAVIATDTPTAAPTTAFYKKISDHIEAYGTEFQQVTTGQCCSPAAAAGTALECSVNECRRFEGGDMYQLSTEFAGEKFPMEDGTETDLTAYSFRMSTVTSEPPGMSLDTTNNYVVFTSFLY